MDNAFEKQSQHLLRQSESQLDADTTRRLNESRQLALASKKYSALPSFVLPATGMIAASLVALGIIYLPLNPVSENSDPLTTDNIELYQDLEFYHWLAEQEDNLNG